MLLNKLLHPLYEKDGDPPGTPPAEPPDTPPQEPAKFKPEEWKGLLPEEMRGNPVIRDLNTPEAVVNSLVEAQGMIGNSIRVPSEDASAEDKQAFHEQLMSKVPGLMLKPDLADDEARNQIYNQLGRPEKGEDYKIPEIDSKGIELDHSTTEAFREIAHAAGLNQAQFEFIVGEITKGNVANTLEKQKSHDAAMLELSKEWGVVYDERLEAIRNFAQQSKAPEALVTALTNNQVDAPTVKWLHEMSEAIGAEGAGLNRDPQHREGRMTATEAKQRIAEIYRNKDHAFWNQEDPEHQDALKYMIELRKMANPDASTDLADLRATAG